MQFMSSGLMPYVEVFLPDGKLARQCHASDECPGRFLFELAEFPSRAKAPRSRVEKAEWQKLAKNRFEDILRKFAINVKKDEDLHRLRAIEKCNKLRLEFRTVPKEQFVENIVKECMIAYHASAQLRLARIQKRIDEGYDVH
ncbi:hypothetical protein GOP47_0031092, partial [Adiantum capillus-veneris]